MAALMGAALLWALLPGGLVDSGPGGGMPDPEAGGMPGRRAAAGAGTAGWSWPASGRVEAAGGDVAPAAAPVAAPGGAARGGSAAGGPGSAATVRGVAWESVNLVVRSDPQGRGLAVLVLARVRNGGPQDSGELVLPWLAGARPGGDVPAGLAWRSGRLHATRPLAPGEEASYTYSLIVDSRATRGRLQVELPAPVGEFYVFTLDGELVARGDGLEDGGTVDGSRLGVDGVRLHVYRAASLPAGRYQVAVMPPGMPGGGSDGATGPASGGSGGPPGTGTGTGPGRAGSTGDGVPEPSPAPAAGEEPGSGQVAGLAAAALAGAAAAAVALRRRGDPAARWQRRRRELIRAIVELDRAYESGEVPEEVYRRERERLLRQAIDATRRWWDAQDRGGTAAPREGTGPAAGGAAGEAAGAGGGRNPAGEAPGRRRRAARAPVPPPPGPVTGSGDDRAARAAGSEDAGGRPRAAHRGSLPPSAGEGTSR